MCIIADLTTGENCIQCQSNNGGKLGIYKDKNRFKYWFGLAVSVGVEVIAAGVVFGFYKF